MKASEARVEVIAEDESCLNMEWFTTRRRIKVSLPVLGDQKVRNVLFRLFRHSLDQQRPVREYNDPAGLKPTNRRLKLLVGMPSSSSLAIVSEDQNLHS